MRELKQAGDHAQHVALFDVPYDTVAHPTKLPGGRVELTLPGGFTIAGFSLDLGEGLVRVQLERSLGGQAKAQSGLVVRLHRSEPLVRVEGFAELGTVGLVRPDGFDRLGYGPAKEERTGDSRAGFAAFEQETAGGRQAVGVAWGQSFPPNLGQPLRSSLCATLLGGPEEPGQIEGARKVCQAGLFAYERPETDWAERGSLLCPKQRPFVRLPDPRLQAQYDLAAYLYRSASTYGAPPMALQGLWTADEGGLPPWKGDYHNDLNTQMTYEAVLAANLWDAGEVWTEFNWELLPRYRRFAREFYGLDGDAAAIPGVMALNGDPLGGWGQYSLSPSNGAWIAWQFAERWRYTRDRKFLAERAAPFCFAIGEGLARLLEPVEGADAEQGPLRLPLSSSPEIYDNTPAAWLEPNSNYDQTLLMALFKANRELAEALGNAAQVERWSELLARLEPLVLDEQGALAFARGEPFAASHRHFSHAMAIHPLGLLSIDDEGQRRIIEPTLDALDAHGTRAWVGYSFAWASAMNAVAGRGDAALRYLEDYLCFTGPNGFHLNGAQCERELSAFRYRPFTLEGNFMAMDAIQRLLLQQRSGRLILFPAVPARWPDVAFGRLAAPGRLVVSAERRGGRTLSVDIESPLGGELWLEDPFVDPSEGPSNSAPNLGGTWSIQPLQRVGTRLRFELDPGTTLHGRGPGDLPATAR
jgi:alpha-L-fucosidase 2